MSPRKIRIAVQKSGRLKDQSTKLINKWGIKLESSKGRLVVPSKDGRFEVMFVRYSDIPQYVQGGAADLGIVGQNLLYENKFRVNVVREFNFGECKLVLAVPEKSKLKDISELEGERIATSYPKSLRKFLKRQNISAAIINIKGGVEAAPAIGLADAICDLTQTGNTIKANHLREVATVYGSRAVLIESKFSNPEKLRKFKEILMEQS